MLRLDKYLFATIMVSLACMGLKSFGNNNPVTQNSIVNQTMASGITLYDWVGHATCPDDCDGSVLIYDYTYDDYGYEPLSIIWINAWEDTIGWNDDIYDLCPGNYFLAIEFMNGQDTTIQYTINSADTIPPTIELFDLTFDMENYDFQDDYGSLSLFNVVGDTIIEAGLTCPFGVNDVIGYLEDLDTLLLNYYVFDNCDNNLLVENDDWKHENENYPNFLASGKFYLSDHSGNISSIELIFYVETFYQPIIDALEVTDDQGFYDEYPIGGGENVNINELHQGKSYQVNPIVDPVCLGNSVMMNWDLNNDGSFENEESVFEFTPDSAGTYEVNIRAYGKNLQNFSSEILISFEVQGINLQATIQNSSCDEDCSGAVLVDYEFFGDDYEPVSFLWKNTGTNETVSTNTDLLNACPGTYELTIGMQGGESFTSDEFTIIEEDKDAPEIDLNLLDDYLFNSILNTRQALFIEDISQPDTLEIGTSCSLDSIRVGKFLDTLSWDFLDFMTDDCDAELEVIAGETQYEKNNYELFLASKKITVRDDAGNEFSRVFLVYTFGFHSPEFNNLSVLIDGNELTEYAVFGGSLDDALDFNINEDVMLIADVDPVCLNNPLEVKWDFNADFVFDAENDTIVLPYENFGAYKLSVQAFGTAINNSQSEEVFVDVNVVGYTIEVDRTLDCINECNNSLEAVINHFGTEYEIANIEWFDLVEENIVSSTRLATGLCLNDYQLTVVFSGGEMETRTEEMSIDVQANIADETCENDNDGQIEVISVNGINNFSLEWFDENFNSISTENPVTGLASGNYSLVVTDISQNCPYPEISYEVLEGIPYPIAAFSIENEGANPVTFLNESQNAIRYIWDFGNNDSMETEILETTYNYNEIGNYEVELIALNERNCSDTVVRQIVIENVEVLGIGDLTDLGIKIYPNPVSHQTLNLDFNQNIDDPFELKLLDAKGRIVNSFDLLKPGLDDAQLLLNGLTDGIYYLSMDVNGNWYQAKIIVRTK